MSKADLNKFSDLVLRDLNLQNKLMVLTDREEFIVFVINLGTELGFLIQREDIELQLRENRRLWHERWI